MPSPNSYWLFSAPLEGSGHHELHSQITHTLLNSSAASSAGLQPSSISPPISLPPLRVGTLAALIGLSESLPKSEGAALTTISKIRETLSSLLNDDRSQLEQHMLVREQSVDDYILGGWSWNGAKYRVEQSLDDVVATLDREVQSIDGVMKQKLQNYNIVKGQLQQLQRKKTGNLSVRSLADVVHKDDFVDSSSEFLETLLVAVPKNNLKDWTSKYERLTSMVVPRSSKKLAQDEEYALFNVTVFKKVKDEFVQKARENRFQVREFQWEDDVVEKSREELENAGTSEKELWTELLRLSRINFSECYQVLTHIKAVRLYVESVLRYGLPADYYSVAIKPNAKRVKGLETALSNYFSSLEGKAAASRRKKSNNSGGGDNEVPGEYAALLEEELLPFVVIEVPFGIEDE
ncbi:unnamed protein product [Sympodiomycopsis kandeliae]